MTTIEAITDTLNRGTSRAEYNEQGKSNRYINAQNNGKLTAGEAAKVLSKKLGVKLTGKLIEPLASEYHHAGRFGKNKAKRVFFFSPEELDKITLEMVTGLETKLYGWRLGFRPSYGKYGRKIGYKPIIAEIGEFDQSQAHRLGDKFNEVTKEELEEMIATEALGKVLPAYCSDWRQAK